MKQPKDLEKYLHAIFQINPEKEKQLGGLFIVAEKVHEWGIQGYLLSPYDTGNSLIKFKGRAYLRPKWEDIEYCGHIKWVFEDKEDEVS